MRIFSANELILDSVSNEDLIDIKEKLLDASATLTLLVGDLSSEVVTDVIGIPAAALPTLVELKSNLISIIDCISTSVDAGHKEAALAYETLYTNQAGSRTAGRPFLNTTKDQLEHLRSLHFPWKEIADLLGVSISTIQRRRAEFGMEEENFSSLTDEELDSIYI